VLCRLYLWNLDRNCRYRVTSSEALASSVRVASSLMRDSICSMSSLVFITASLPFAVLVHADTRPRLISRALITSYGVVWG
jgi:hypothetical protein